jgi:hypothetical protein
VEKIGRTAAQPGRVSDDGIRVKIRETTREGSFTVPHSEEQKVDFFHGEEWEELHVVHKETKILLAVYTRAQVFCMLARVSVRRVKHRSGVTVNILPL